ncbi:MAG: hypothetical protein GF331_17715 [Chitinivibrionales bacterium]|nr:hypothetical protein [Chitinivibrionales bacterium]
MSDSHPTPHRLIILSGPSCVGKSPLVRALGRLYPDLLQPLQPLVLYNSRSPRPGELDGVDYHFRPRADIERFRSAEGFVVMDVRGDLQALDVGALQRTLDDGDVLFEGNPFVGTTLLEHPRLAAIPVLGMFMSPLSAEEISSLQALERHVDVPGLVADIMRRKLLRRTRRQKGELSLPDLEDIERRATSAYGEMRNACRFEHVLVNHDGEDSENWDAFYYPLGDARRCLDAFVAMLRGEEARWVESWDSGLLA